MYTGMVIEDLIQCVEKAEQRARATAYEAVEAAPMASAPLVRPTYEMNWQDWTEMVEVA